jgi:hypothetical protein
MKIRRIVLFTAVILLVAVAGVTARLATQNLGYSHPSFTLHSQIYHHGQLTGEETLSFFRSGDFREQKRDGDHVYGTARIRGVGFFVIDDSRQWIRKDARVNFEKVLTVPSLEQLRQSPNYVKDDTVLGIPAVMLRQGDANTGRPVAEWWFAPTVTGSAMIKRISYEIDTGEELTRHEPVSIDHTEPDPSLLKLPNYRVIES